MSYLDKKIEESKNLMSKCTNDKKYYSLERRLDFLNGVKAADKRLKSI